jgi:hypothetical protein
MGTLASLAVVRKTPPCEPFARGEILRAIEVYVETNGPRSGARVHFVFVSFIGMRLSRIPLQDSEAQLFNAFLDLLFADPMVAQPRNGLSVPMLGNINEHIRR